MPEVAAVVLSFDLDDGKPARMGFIRSEMTRWLPWFPFTIGRAFGATNGYLGLTLHWLGPNP